MTAAEECAVECLQIEVRCAGEQHEINVDTKGWKHCWQEPERFQVLIGGILLRPEFPEMCLVHFGLGVWLEDACQQLQGVSSSMWSVVVKE